MNPWRNKGKAVFGTPLDFCKCLLDWFQMLSMLLHLAGPWINLFIVVIDYYVLAPSPLITCHTCVRNQKTKNRWSNFPANNMHQPGLSTVDNHQKINTYTTIQYVNKAMKWPWFFGVGVKVVAFMLVLTGIGICFSRVVVDSWFGFGVFGFHPSHFVLLGSHVPER